MNPDLKDQIIEQYDAFVTHLLKELTPEQKTLYKAIKIDAFQSKIEDLKARLNKGEEINPTESIEVLGRNSPYRINYLGQIYIRQ